MTTKWWIGAPDDKFSNDLGWSLTEGGSNDTTHPVSGDNVRFTGGGDMILSPSDVCQDFYVNAAGFDLESSGNFRVDGDLQILNIDNLEANAAIWFTYGTVDIQIDITGDDFELYIGNTIDVYIFWKGLPTNTKVTIENEAEAIIADAITSLTADIVVTEESIISDNRKAVSIKSVLVEDGGEWIRWDGLIYTVDGFLVESDGKIGIPDLIFPPTQLGTVSEEDLFLLNLEFLIASCETFQDWVGATGTTAQKIDFASDRIYLSRVKETQVVLPFAQIGHNPGFKKGDSAFEPSEADMWIDFVGSFSEIDSESEMKSFRTTVGKITEEMEQLQGKETYLRFREIVTASEFAFSGVNELKQKSGFITYNVITGA